MVRDVLVILLAVQRDWKALLIKNQGGLII
jgi:hypothetical protein